MKRTGYAIAGAVTAAMMSSTAMAADLGGNCCADLEERIAELEATTVRKGNRKVSLSVSGFVSHAILWWDDGTQRDMYIGDMGALTSRFRFRGEAKINHEWTAGFLYEFAGVSSAVSSGNQLNGGDDLSPSGAPNNTTHPGCGQTSNQGSTVGCVTVREQLVWLRNARLGKFQIGQGSTASNGTIGVDLGGMGSAYTPDHPLFMGGFILRGNNGQLAVGSTAVTSAGANWQAAIRASESFLTSRRNHIMYESPTLHGFFVQATVAEDNFWDMALRYAGEFNGVRLAFALSYAEDSKYNGGFQQFNQNGFLCTTNCDVKATDLRGSASILHTPTGLFVTGAYGNRELSGSHLGTAATQYVGPDVRFWHIAGGIARNHFGIGNTVLFAEYGEHKGGLAQAAFLANGATGANTHCAGASGCDSTVTNWGLGMTQAIDAAAMELYLTYKNYALDTNGFAGANAHLNKGAAGASDFSIIMLGTKINF